ncbi:MAG TPA: tetratricopeptide repeat protein [Bryobacteraceae bacterium]|jgi:tetratricopeptide (TPR) repeat protein|nr:tetratricopeptide repeat protein [Bryobacteraceae bacterium]
MRAGTRFFPILAFLLLASVAYSPGSAQESKPEVEAHIQKARDAIAHHDLKLASDEYEEALKLDPGNAEITAARGVSLYALGDPAEASRVLRSALALDPHRSDASLFLGLSLADLAKCQEAMPLLMQHFTERTEPKLRRVVGLSLLSCESASSKQESALETGLRLQRWYPDDPDVLYQLAELYSQFSRETVNELLKKHPESYRIHQLAGEALEAQNNNSQALIEYRKALELNPKAPHTHYRIATLLLQGKQTDQTKAEALQHFKQELAINPADAASHYQIGEILLQANHLDEAAPYLAQALELNPVFVEAYIAVARIAMAQHRMNDAIAQLQKATQVSPNNRTAHYSLMMAYRDAGKTDEANRELVIVQNLSASEENDFQRKLQALLTGQASQR